MSVETFTRTTCDRCNGKIAEVKDSSAGKERAAEPKLYVARAGKPEIKFGDLCKKCEKRVDALYVQLHLSKDEKKEKKPNSNKPADEPPAE